MLSDIERSIYFSPQEIMKKGISFLAFLGKHELECLAQSIFGHCIQVYSWKPFTTEEAESFLCKNYLPDFVETGLLILKDGKYEITDLFIEALLYQAKIDNPKSEWPQRKSHIIKRLLQMCCDY